MNLFDGRKKDLKDEIESHLRMATADRVAAGAEEEDAKREAMRDFGNVPLIADVTRDGWGWLRMENFVQDLRYALRTLRRDLSFTTVAVLILALGIGANVVVFSVVNTLLLRPLPFKDPQRLAWLAGGNGAGGLSVVTYRADAYDAFRDHNRSFEKVTGFCPFYSYSSFNLTGHGDPQPVAGVWVLGDFFSTLGVQPILGRDFTAEEAARGRPPVMLSYAYWQTQFQGDRSIVGKTIGLDGVPVTVVGGFHRRFAAGAQPHMGPVCEGQELHEGRTSGRIYQCDLSGIPSRDGHALSGGEGFCVDGYAEDHAGHPD